MCRILSIRVVIAGAVDADRPLLVVGNHFGVIDPLILASQLEISFVGKAELRRWPLVGWVTRQVGVIFVERERHGRVNDFLTVVRERLDRRIPVMVFPEGTTSPDETVLPFKTGAFEAVTGRLSAAVLPVYLRPVRVNGRPAVGETRGLVTWAGGNQSFVEHLFQLVNLESAEVEIRIGEAIPAGQMERKELARKAHAAVVALAHESRRRRKGHFSTERRT